MTYSSTSFHTSANASAFEKQGEKYWIIIPIALDFVSQIINPKASRSFQM